MPHVSCIPIVLLCIFVLVDSIKLSELVPHVDEGSENHHDSTRALLFTDTAYYISSTSEYDIFVPSIVTDYASKLASTYEICMSTRLGRRIYCGESVNSNRFTIPVNEVENTLKPNKLCSILWIINSIHITTDKESIIESEIYVTTLDSRPSILSHVEIKNYYGALPSYSGEPAVHIVYDCDSIAKQSADHVYFEIKGVTDRLMPVVGDGLQNSVHVHGGVEPASWFYSLTPKFYHQASDNTDATLTNGYPSFGYIEFTLNNEDIQKERLYTTERAQFSSSKSSLAAEESPTAEKTVCIWGSNSLDGQKRIWLSQMEHLVNQFNLIYILTDRFQSVNLTDPNAIKEDTMTSVLLTSPQFAHVKVVESPYNGVSITKELLAADVPGWDGEPRMFYDYMHKILLVDSNNDVHKIKVEWAREIYMKLYDFLTQQSCDVIVFGNNRLSPDNRLITNVAKILNVSTVIELVNLFIDPETTPSVIVGPSLYSIRHSSIQSFVANHSSVQTTVIAPAVDTNNKFNVEFFQNNTKFPVYHPGCLDSIRRGHRCYNIGFVARLSNEKNPGLFVLASKILLDANPLLKFTVIGDGDLMPSLMELTERLQIRHAFVFTGWVNSDLDRHLMGIDIIVNPSIRGWSETFCIANIEAMAMKRPLVTYAAGGVGEYVAQPNDLNHHELYSISKNAIIVNYPTPAAVSSAVQALLTNETLRNSIAIEGYNTVISYFTVERQMKQYQELYRSL